MCPRSHLQHSSSCRACVPCMRTSTKSIPLHAHTCFAQDEVKEILQQAQDASAPLDKQLASEVQKLGERRFALVSGKSHPEPSELEGLDDAEALAAATGGASAAAGSSVKGSVKGVPYFWVSVLSNCDAVSEHISGRDRLALEYLRDVRRVAGRVAGVNGVELVFDAKVSCRLPVFEGSAL